MDARIQVGCQGWNYDDWVTKPGGEPVFYPAGTRSAEMLSTYARAFESVEVDSTFYATPTAAAVENWARRTPPRFTFSLKLPREITHELALREESYHALDDFCDRARALGEKLGAVLIQLPPHFAATEENERALRSFLTRLPRAVRFAVEFRSPEWARPEIGEMLAEFGVALALVEGQWIERRALWRAAVAAAVSFAYIRWMGERDLTRFDLIQRPQDPQLQKWDRALRQLPAHVSTVYAYFSNFYEGHAPASANKLKRLLGQQVVAASDLEDQPSLF